MRILLLDLDTLRPDHLGCYGYHRNTSPNIDSICEEGVRFDNYYTPDAPCLPSRAALMSGRFGIHTGVVGHGGTAADFRLDGKKRGFRDTMGNESLPAFLRQSGFKTATISPFGERHSAWWFYAGFNEIHNTGNKGMESGKEITPTAIKWLKENAKDDNWFLHINYWDAHTPYRAPDEYGNPFENEPIRDWITEDILEEHKKMVGPHCAREVNNYTNKKNPKYPKHPSEILDMDGLKKMIDGYDTSIKYMDGHLGQLFNQLKEKGVYDDTIIIITADHGENQGELGIYGEHGTADKITCNIPMLIKWPGCKSGTVDDRFHYNLDLLPTLAEMFGQDRKASWDGSSFASALRKDSDIKKDSSRDYLVVSQCAHVCQRGVRFKDWMYIRTYHDGFHLFPKEMLFDIKNDQFEQHNLAEELPALCHEGNYLLSEWHDIMMSTMESQIDPLWTVIKEGGPFHAKNKLENYITNIHKAGREELIEELIRRHPEEFD